MFLTSPLIDLIDQAIARFDRWSLRATAILRQLRLKGTDGRIDSCEMELGEKFIRRLLKFVFMILAFIVAIGFRQVLSSCDESARGLHCAPPPATFPRG